jgi:predicted TIM-barrel fold metal-dependent hydrolase
MRVITLEEHFVTANFLAATHGDQAPPALRAMQEKLLDLGDGRIAAMDEGGVDVQVLSLAANGFDSLDATTATSLARDVNDELAAAIAKHPDRLAGFATLALKDPAQAAVELERCVRELGFKGALIDGTCDGEFMDQPKFLPVFEAAQALDVPIYLHPAVPPAAVRDVYFGGMAPQAAFLLSIAGWGWHAETGLHTLRLIVSGLFERLPNLKLIIGHMGEGIPYALARSTSVLNNAMTDLPLGLSDYFRRNVWVTTSGYFTAPPLKCAIEVLGIDRMMYSIDYPFSATTTGKKYLESLDLSPEDMEKLAGQTAATLLKI